MAHLGQSRSVISRLEPAQTSIHMLWSVLAGWRVWLVLMFKRRTRREAMVASSTGHRRRLPARAAKAGAR